MPGMAKIRGNSVLPARREAITLHTADGLDLLALPEDRDPVATIVCLHPLPTHGGMMDSQVFRSQEHLRTWAEGGKYLWVGDAERVPDEIVSMVAPDVPTPLPVEWDGPMETADSSAYADRTTRTFKDVPR